MAERKAVNKYYPPDWDPSKGSLNTHLSQHPLRARARKLNEGILVVRFEMPFNVWCGHCAQHIGRGVRFNAEKKKVGDYYSSVIWSFRMKCHLCGQWMEIQTDPKTSEYICKEGIKRKVEDASAEALGLPALSNANTTKLMQDNPFFRLEHTVVDQNKAKELIPKLSAIQELNAQKWSRNYEVSQSLRRKFREEKKDITKMETSDAALKAKLSIDVPLKLERPEDKLMARNTIKEQRRRDPVGKAMNRIKQTSIFGKRRKTDRSESELESGSVKSKSFDFIKK